MSNIFTSLNDNASEVVQTVENNIIHVYFCYTFHKCHTYPLNALYTGLLVN